ncbi:hypothetical protein [Poriferisphaera sp. WC338]|uniref:hypothetical protein n=1 Tax=Poriferisphaera sp. WC338 TaxID=3425129 RepID=UPI003D8195D9
MKHVKKSICAVVASVAMFTGLGQAQAAPVTVSDSETGWGTSLPSDVTITFNGLNTNVIGGGWLQVWAFGDFDRHDENISIVANAGQSNAMDFGTWLDNNTANDDFSHPTNDQGNQYSYEVSGTAYLTASEVQSLISGGSLELTFSFGPNVDELQNNPNERVGARFHYNAGKPGGGTPAVPTPAAAGMVLVSLGMLIARRRHNKA